MFVNSFTKNKEKVLGCVVITDSQSVAITWRAAAKTLSQVKTQAKWQNCDLGINLSSTSGIVQHTHAHTHTHSIKQQPPATATDQKPNQSSHNLQRRKVIILSTAFTVITDLNTCQVKSCLLKHLITLSPKTDDIVILQPCFILSND